MDYTASILSSITFAFLAFVIVFVNGFCLNALRKSRSRKDIRIIFLKSLTTSDLFVGLFKALPFAILYGAQNTTFKRWTFMFAFSSTTMCFIAGSYSLLAVSFDRLIAIVWPLRYPSLVTRGRTKFIVIGIWIAAIANDDIHKPFIWSIAGMQSHQNYTIGSGFDHVSSIYIDIIFMCAPFVILVLIYSKLYFVARRHANFVASQHGSFSTLKNKTTSIKAAKSLFIITASYLIAWSPTIGVQLYGIITTNEVPFGFDFMADILSCCYSIINPIFYYRRLDGIRKTTKKNNTFWQMKSSQTQHTKD